MLMVGPTTTLSNRGWGGAARRFIEDGVAA